MESELLKMIKDIKGTVLVIGFDETNKIFNSLNSNKNITEVLSLTNEGKEKGKRKMFGEKKINIKKLKRYFGEKKFSYLICNFEIIRPFFKSFVFNSILLNDEKLYFYLRNSDYEVDEIIARYERYGGVSKSIGNSSEKLVIIDNKNSKVKFIKRLIYFIRDTWHDLIELIATILIS